MVYFYREPIGTRRGRHTRDKGAGRCCGEITEQSLTHRVDGQAFVVNVIDGRLNVGRAGHGPAAHRERGVPLALVVHEEERLVFNDGAAERSSKLIVVQRRRLARTYV